jgi:DNA-binding transcriptional ArsR family regulator
VRAFASRFRENFAQSLLVGVLWALFGTALVLDFFVAGRLSFVPEVVMKSLLVLATVLYASASVFLFPVMVHYEMGWKALLKNSLLFSIGRLPTTAACLLFVAVVAGLTAFCRCLILITGSVTAYVVYGFVRPRVRQGWTRSPRRVAPAYRGGSVGRRGPWGVLGYQLSPRSWLYCTAMLDNQKMLAEQRRGVILEELGRAGSVSVADLSRRLKVSDMTIRRDLEELSGRKLLRKVHGGAVPLPKAAAEPHFEQKRKLNRPEKLAIAKVAQAS